MPILPQHTEDPVLHVRFREDKESVQECTVKLEAELGCKHGFVLLHIFSTNYYVTFKHLQVCMKARQGLETKVAQKPLY